MYCFNVELTLIFFKRIRINLIVSALQLLCVLLFSIFLLHNIKKNWAVAIRRSKLRQILVKFCCVYTFNYSDILSEKISSWYHYTQSLFRFYKPLFGIGYIVKFYFFVSVKCVSHRICNVAIFGTIFLHLILITFNFTLFPWYSY